MDVGKTKEVFYHEYCNKCKWNNPKTLEDKEYGLGECNLCLNQPYNEYSHKPIKFKGE